jgi:hypothetical protein
MSSFGCNEFINHLDSWMEGEREPGAEAHIEVCESCRCFAADLDAIQSAAPTLSVADPEPPARVWTALRAQMIEEGLIRETVPATAATEKSWFERLFPTVPRPALAGGYLALLVAVAFGLSGPLGQNTTAPPSFPLSAELDNAEQTTVSSFVSSKSPISASLHQNLEIVDHYIALCEKSVREEPGNDAAREYLYHAYQQKADLLALITERGDLIQ